MPRLLLVHHDTGEAALDGAVAGLLAAQTGARLRRLAGGRDLDGLDVRQHVLAEGGLAANGVLWAERASGRPVEARVDIDGPTGLPADGPVVVSVNPRVAGHGADAALAAEAARRGWDTGIVRVRAEGALLEAVSDGGNASEQPAGRWRRDAFGRVVPLASALSMRIPPEPMGEPVDNPPRILLLGNEEHHRRVYPAALAALGDAADGLDRRVKLRFLAPDEAAALGDLLPDMADGLLLPGGSDMGQVAGQIAAARIALRHGLPTVGLCLGMQSMAAAALRERLGLEGATLAEADPAAACHGVVLRPDTGGPAHRLGEDRTELIPSSQLGRLYGRESTLERYNHRYVLNPALIPALERAGVSVPAWAAAHRTADAVEAAGHPFFIGMQGHPELNSAAGRPHPLLTGFLRAAIRRADTLRRLPS